MALMESFYDVWFVPCRVMRRLDYSLRCDGWRGSGICPAAAASEKRPDVESQALSSLTG